MNKMEARQSLATSFDWNNTFVQQPPVKKKRSLLRLPTPTRVEHQENHFFDDAWNDIVTNERTMLQKSDGLIEAEVGIQEIYENGSSGNWYSNQELTTADGGHAVITPMVIQKPNKMLTVLKIIRRPSFRRSNGCTNENHFFKV